MMFPWLLVAYEALRETPSGELQSWKRFVPTLPFFAVVGAYVAVRTLLFGLNTGQGPGGSRFAALLDIGAAAIDPTHVDYVAAYRHVGEVAYRHRDHRLLLLRVVVRRDASHCERSRWRADRCGSHGRHRRSRGLDGCRRWGRRRRNWCWSRSRTLRLRRRS